MSAAIRPAVEHRPATVGEVAATLRDAAKRSTSLRIVGGGSWLAAGRPVGESERLHLGGLRGILEYEPGDLTLTAAAGTTLAEIEEATRANGQFLALDPFGAPEGTIGATVATASYGPLSHAFGGPRDATIGLAFVIPDGGTIHAGGRVVKNVAGFDLVRLLVGSWGTLGAIVEVSVRLRALPEVDETIAIPLPGDSHGLSGMLAALRAAPIAPWAAELICANLAGDLGLPSRALLLLRLAGNPESVTAQQTAARTLGFASAVPATVWARLRDFERIAPSFAAAHAVDENVEVGARYSSRPSNLAQLWYHALAVAATGEGRAHATVSRGVVRVQLRGRLSSVCGALGLPHESTILFERLPAILWADVDSSPHSDPISRSLRANFDPQAVLNPGILAPR